MEPVETPASPAQTIDQLPTWITAAWNEPQLDRKGWPTSIAPAFIGLFLWVVFFDQLPGALLAGGSLALSVLGVGLAGFLALALFYYAPAVWGFRTGLPLALLATRPFGTRGAAWVPGLVLVVAQVVWFAVGVGYGAGLCLTGLLRVGLLDEGFLVPVSVGGRAWTPVLFMVVAVLWSVCAALIGRYLVRVIAALMTAFPLLPALILGAAMVASFRGLPAGRDAVAGVGGAERTGAETLFVAFQMVLGFFATSGVASADWGAASRSLRDVRVGGLVSVTLASWIVATLAILTVVGTLGRVGFEFGPEPGMPFPPRTFHAALTPLFGPRLGGAMLLAFGLAALAPSVYCSYLFGTQLHELRPRLSRTAWTLIGAAVSWPLVITGVSFRLFDVFGVVGALVAPVCGVFVADFVRSRGEWPAARGGWNWPGLLAWIPGAVVGVVPLIGHWTGNVGPTLTQPAVLLSFFAAFATYLVLAALGLESPVETRLDFKRRHSTSE